MAALAPCTGYCNYGHSGFVRNRWWEYDGSKCGCKRCPNNEVCRGGYMLPEHDVFGGTCSTCVVHGLAQKTLVIVDRQIQDCVICLNTRTRFVQHPAGCGHVICVDCTREIWCGQGREPNEHDYNLPVICTCAWCADPTSLLLCWEERDRLEALRPEVFVQMEKDADALADHYDNFHKDLNRIPMQCPVCRALAPIVANV